MNQEAGPHETPIWQHLYVGLSILQKVRNNCLLFKTPVYSIFVIAAPKGFIQAVYYLVCGGDFNKDLSGNAEEYFGISGKEYTWAQPIPSSMFDNTNLSLIFAYDELLKTPSCRNADDVYNPNQFVLTVDGFIISDNVELISSKVIDLRFEYSDHNPVEMIFKLK